LRWCVYGCYCVVCGYLETKSFGISYLISSLFRSVIVVAFQSVFHTEMHQNNVFLFFKNYF
jgi:hypothetical protein